MTAPVVADTTVWSNFAHAGRPRLVERAFPAVVSPPEVVEEIAVGVRLGSLPDLDWSFVRRIELSEREVATPAARARRRRAAGTGRARPRSG
jgi:hypothetical protein